MNPSFAVKRYSGYIGNRVFAISSSLSLSTEGRLSICVDSHKDLIDSQECNKKIIDIHSKCSKDNRYCYAGWMVKMYGGYDNFENKWFGYIEKHPPIGELLVNIYNKFSDILDRLYYAQDLILSLESEYSEYKDQDIGYYDRIEEINNDIRILSKHGIKIAKVAKRLLITIKPKIIKSDAHLYTITEREKIMKGIRSFENDIGSLDRSPDIAIDDSIQNMMELIDAALDNFERSLDK